MRYFFLCLVFMSSSAIAGNYVSMASESGADDYIMQMEPNRIRIDMTDKKDGSKRSIIYFNKYRMAQMIDHAKKTYIEMNEEDMKKMAKSMSAAFKMMEAQMAKLPPAMREQLKGKMGGIPMPQKEDFKPMSLKKIKSGVMVGDFKTDHQKVMRGTKTVSEFWTVPLSQLKLEKNSYQILYKMSDFFNTMSKSLGSKGSEMSGGFEAWKQINGIPVKVINFEKKGQKTMVLKEAKTKKFPETLFQVPKDYKGESVDIRGMPGSLK